MLSTPPIDLGYNGLTEHTEGLAADAYYDPRQYERELQRIWYRNWVYVGRSTDVPRVRGSIAHRQHHLSVPRLGLQPAGRLAAHVLQVARQRLRRGRFSPLQDQRQGM